MGRSLLLRLLSVLLPALATIGLGTCFNMEEGIHFQVQQFRGRDQSALGSLQAQEARGILHGNSIRPLPLAGATTCARGCLARGHRARARRSRSAPQGRAGLRAQARARGEPRAAALRGSGRRDARSGRNRGACVRRRPAGPRHVRDGGRHCRHVGKESRGPRVPRRSGQHRPRGVLCPARHAPP